jgi:DNA-binding response OmpR family regulator
VLKANILPTVTEWFKRDSQQTPHNIMVISDDLDYLHQICSALTETGCTVTVPGNVLETLIMLDEGQMPHLFICDFREPQVDGKTLIEKMRIRFGRRTMPPIIFLLDSPEDEVMARELGVDDVLPKSLEVEVMVASLAKIMERIATATRQADVKVTSKSR